MHSQRCYVSVVELNGLIYALGGFDGKNRLNTAERYDPITNQWTLIPSMNFLRSDAHACTLNGKIYITGMWLMNYIVIDQPKYTRQFYVHIISFI